METVADLIRLLDQPEHRLIRDRMRAVILRRRGWTFARIGNTLARSEMWVKRWNDRFKAGGVAGLCDQVRGGSKPRLSPEATAAFVRKVETEVGAIKTIRDVREILSRDFSVSYSRSGTRSLLTRLGFVKLRPRPKHPECDAARQVDFVMNELPLFSRERKSIAQRSESKSGSKTRRATASKVD